MAKALVSGLRLAGAIGSGVAFGLVAAQALPQWSLLHAFLLGLVFGTSFIGGTGYRILVNLARLSTKAAPVSWSGAIAASALTTLISWICCIVFGLPGLPVLAGFGLAINCAYLPVKLACLSAGCCSSVRRLPVLGRADLRIVEGIATAGIIVANLILLSLNLQATALIGIGGHLLVRILSRRWRGRSSWGWPPLRQPGAELLPLVLLVVVVFVASK